MRLNRDKKPALIARAARRVHEGLKHVEPHCRVCPLIKLNCLDDAARNRVATAAKVDAIMCFIRETNYPHLSTDPVKICIYRDFHILNSNNLKIDY